MLRTKQVTVKEFAEFVQQPENIEGLFELINGEIIDVSPGRTRNSELSHLVAVAVHLFCREYNLPCHTSGGDGAYLIGGHVLAPDFAYKTTPMSEDYPDPEPPILVIEIISPTDRAPEIREKRQIYIAAGILLLEMYPQSRSIDMYTPGKPSRTLNIDDVLDAGDVLPGFKLAVRDIFK